MDDKTTGTLTDVAAKTEVPAATSEDLSMTTEAHFVAQIGRRAQ